MTNSTYRRIVIVAGVVTAVVAIASSASAQSHDGLLYGKVYASSGNTYVGVLRWGSEEALWCDLFNAAKITDQFRKMVPESESNAAAWYEIDWSLGGIWEDKIVEHQFNTQFGNLAAIERLSSARARITLRNGREMEISGQGYNDLSSRIYVADPELGTLGFDWSKIERIEFLQTPLKPNATFGNPLYGTVEGVRNEKFTGFIAWDNDERLTSDKLDGDSDDGDVSIRFNDILSIEKEGRGSRVVLRSGRAFYLTGSNDVNSENRGVLVADAEVGVVHLSWDAFRKVTFSDPPKTGLDYSTFRSPDFLSGTVVTLEGDRFRGRIIYDIDEVLDLEILEGDENGIQYHIPFRNIRRIAPRNFDYSTIDLRNGKSLLLGGRQDVSTRNGGILIFESGKDEPAYVQWRKINEIAFE